MATFLTLFVLFVISLTPSTTPTNIPLNTQDLLVAIEEMQTANYFTFVMLINMSPLDQRLLGNVTFLMPNDRMLSKTQIPAHESISDFLLRHSIPSPLIFEHLELIPSGSSIPSSMPEYMLKISNNGRRNFFLNNVKIISPNICTAGSSIRCHGINGVLETKSPLPACPNNTSDPVAAAKPPVPSLSSSSSSSPDQTTMPASPPTDLSTGTQKSGSSAQWLFINGGVLKFLVTFVMVSLVGVISM